MSDRETAENQHLSVEGAAFYRNVLTVIGTYNNLGDDAKREIVEMVIDDEL